MSVDPQDEKREHKRSCPVYGNYQPPYEECNCDAASLSPRAEEPQPQPTCSCGWRGPNPEETMHAAPGRTGLYMSLCCPDCGLYLSAEQVAIHNGEPAEEPLVKRLRRHAERLVPFVSWVERTPGGLMKSADNGVGYSDARRAARDAALILDLREAADLLTSSGGKPVD